MRAVIPHFNFFARMPVCGLIAQYNAAGPTKGTDYLPQFMRTVLTHRIAVRGFIVRDYADQEGEFLREVSSWIAEGRIKYREHKVKGLENAPEMLIGLLKGQNFGKTIVEISEVP